MALIITNNVIMVIKIFGNDNLVWFKLSN